MPTPTPNRLLNRLYSRSLAIYPRPFLAGYRSEMQLVFDDSLAAYRSLPVNRTLRATAFFVSRTLLDLIQSALREHIAMFTSRTFARLLVLQALLLTAIASVLAMVSYALVQQAFRHGANDPQIQIAAGAASRLSHGLDAGTAIPAYKLDVVTDPSPFVIVYDDSGRVLSSTATINGRVPTPPVGVLNYLRSHPENFDDRISWVPPGGPRIAAVVRRYSGAQPGFVLAGRSLYETEVRIGQTGGMVFVGWLAILAIITVGSLAIYWLVPIQNTQPPTQAA